VVLNAKAILLVALMLLAQGASARVYTLKFATLAPEGSTWMNLIAEWAQGVEARSQGRIRLKIYPGGVSGDEPDMLRKIRFGQLHGAALTGFGVGKIYPPTRVLEMPFLFRDYAEIDYVRERLTPDFRPKLREHGFELLGMTEVGIVRFFSKAPIRSLADLRGRRIWLWAGDPLAQAFFTASGLSPIPLSITEVFTSLSTGLIDTVYSPPLAAIAMQWFTKTHYMTETAMGNSIGALVIANRFFNRLPEDLRSLLVETGEETALKMAEASQRDNIKSLDVLKDYGIEFVQWREDDMHQLLETRDRAASALAKQGYIPAQLYDRVSAMLEKYRAAQGADSRDAASAR
jgi:TRAP-type C4-dicarboxylate transport system substrate-binding protein